MRWDVGGFLALWSDGDTEQSKDVAHSSFVVAEIVRHSTISVDEEVVGVCEGFRLVGGK